MEEGEASGQSSTDSPSETHSADVQPLPVDKVCKAALIEIIEKAEQYGIRDLPRPAFGSLDEFLPMFQSRPQPGRIVEYSVAAGILPVQPEYLIPYMTKMDEWAGLSNIVYRASSIAQKGYDSQLQDLQLVDAEIHLPTPFLRRREFRFLRFKVEIKPNVWAIVDVGEEYLHLPPEDTISESRCRRRPSGVIIRDHNQGAEVLWIENMEVREWQPVRPEHNLYSEWPVFKGIEELIRYNNERETYCITVFTRADPTQHGSNQPSECLLQEVSYDGFCAFIVSATMSYSDFVDAVLSDCPRELSFSPLPLGLNVISDGPAGLNSDACVVNIVHQLCDREAISTEIDRIIAEICEEARIEVT